MTTIWCMKIYISKPYTSSCLNGRVLVIPLLLRVCVLHLCFSVRGRVSLSHTPSRYFCLLSFLVHEFIILLSLSSKTPFFHPPFLSAESEEYVRQRLLPPITLQVVFIAELHGCCMKVGHVFSHLPRLANC